MQGRLQRSKRSRVVLRLAVVGAAAIAAVGVASSLSAGALAFDVIGVFGVLGFTAVGALILDRRPSEPIGRICLAIGVAYAVAAMLRYVVVLADGLDGVLPPFFAALAVFSSAIASLALVLSGPLLISRFPRRAPTAWFRWVEDVLIVAVGAIVLVGTFRASDLDFGGIEHVPNPMAIGWIPLDSTTTDNVTWLFYGAAYAVTMLGLIDRYRLGTAVVRAQIRWFAAAIAVSLALFVVVTASGDDPVLNDIAWAAWLVSLLFPLAAITIAVLRYRLFDIDRIISGTVAYAVITALLFAVFAVVNVGLQSALRGTGEPDPIFVAVATLTVAALFNPLRTRVQRNVDRRFHRARYDAQRTVDDFSRRLRNELDLRTLARELTRTTDLAVEPTTISVWLRARPLES